MQQRFQNRFSQAGGLSLTRDPLTKLPEFIKAQARLSRIFFRRYQHGSTPFLAGRPIESTIVTDLVDREREHLGRVSGIT